MALVSSPNAPQFAAGRCSNPPLRSSSSSPARNDNNKKNKLLFIGFNQDFGCVAVGTETGFTVYNSDPFKETLRREFNDGGIGVVEMLFRCNILAIVGGGSNPPYPPNKVMIWDDHQSRCIGELSFRAEVRGVKLRRDMIVVVLEHKIYVYNFADLKLLHQIETVFNGEGVSALSSSSTNAVLACPGLRKGQLRLDHLSRKKTMFIMAHDSYLSCIAITSDGRFVATSSHRGTLIRVFNTLDGTRIQELRRGTDRAVIYSLAFSANAQWLAVSSDKGTVHVFGLRSFTGIGDRVTTGQASKDEIGTVNNGGTSNIDSAILASNPGSSLSFMRGVLPSYFSSEWSFAQFRLPEETRAIVGFGPQKNTILIVSTDGRFYKCAFDPVRGGEMIQQEYTKFLRPDEDESHL